MEIKQNRINETDLQSRIEYGYYIHLKTSDFIHC